MGIADFIRPREVEEPAKSPRVSAPRAMTAAGERIKLRNPDEAASLRTRVYNEWQKDAWAYYDSIAEIAYGFDLVSAVMSRIRLYPALSIDADGVPISTVNYLRRKIDQSQGEMEKDLAGELTLPPAITKEVVEYLEDLVADLFSGHGGQSSLLRSFALNICVAGECYLINYKDKWSIRSTDEIVATGDERFLLRRLRPGGTTSTTANGQPGDVELPKNTYVGRIWREHPRYSMEPTSSMLSLREMCDELLTLQRMIRVVARSRMNAGILYVPDGLVVSGSTVNEETVDDEEALDEIIADIYDTVTAPIEDETNAATVFPTIVTGPKDAAQSLRLISLARDSDQFLVDRTDRTLERILQGLDMPKDVVSGMANVKYSNAIQIDESLYKGHIEPLALMLVDALTTMYIHPALKKKFGLRQRELDYLRVWYDPSEVVTKSDPAASANTGYDNFAISAAAWRAAHGFSDTDAPSEHELAQRYLFLKGVPQPEQLGVLMKEAFPTITDAQRAANMANSPVPMPESAQEKLFGKVIQPVDRSTRDGANPSVSASESATSVNPGNPTSGRPTGTYNTRPEYGE
ncbi:portal protein [Gordonia phage Forza]|uniref:Portal protein n=1 Tax=Gordonia phage Forza TaxID=2571247 RepID=A0A650EYE4_9CAUD|nr:portal protein [Gordonia phage Forza]QEM41546.1 portal protein [Gordonia phage Boopy]QGT55070.1 portal protein [Gordonia phage Forza]UXE04220.1 portal protein [Gordonia phage BlueNGold]WBF03859.1 portal protein [Gordonia phage Mareelih]